MTNSRQAFIIHLSLCRTWIALFSALSAGTGFIIAAHQIKAQMVIVLAGVFFLACGSSALNQYQERDTDALMNRTRNRPLPAQQIEPACALYFSLILISLGSLTLLLSGNLIVPALGICAVVLYNGMYTPLKKRTAFAAFPGALIGAIPPVIGWVAAGGQPLDPRIGAVSFFFFIWQIPHFWLLTAAHAEDYERAGLPSLTGLMSTHQVSRILFMWIFSVAIACSAFPCYGIVSSSPVLFVLGVAMLLLIRSGADLLRKCEEGYVYTRLFKRMNAYLFAVMVLLTADRVLTYAL